MMGFAWGMGGFSVPFVGMLADRIGIERTLRRPGPHAAVRGGVSRCPLPETRRPDDRRRGSAVGQIAIEPDTAEVR